MVWKYLREKKGASIQSVGVPFWRGGDDSVSGSPNVWGREEILTFANPRGMEKKTTVKNSCRTCGKQGRKKNGLAVGCFLRGGLEGKIRPGEEGGWREVPARSSW